MTLKVIRTFFLIVLDMDLLETQVSAANCSYLDFFFLYHRDLTKAKVLTVQQLQISGATQADSFAFLLLLPLCFSSLEA